MLLSTWELPALIGKTPQDKGRALKGSIHPILPSALTQPYCSETRVHAVSHLFKPKIPSSSSGNSSTQNSSSFAALRLCTRNFFPSEIKNRQSSVNPLQPLNPLPPKSHLPQRPLRILRALRVSLFLFPQ